MGIGIKQLLMINKLYIFGVERSGTTILSAMVGAHPDVNTGRELVIEPVAAVPADRRVYRYRIRPVNALDYVPAHIVVQAHADNGNMVFGLFFVPSSQNLPPDWRERAAGWAAWNWGRPGACIRIPTPTDTRLRSNPGAYIPTLLRGLLNRRELNDWQIEETPELPPWYDGLVWFIEEDDEPEEPS